MFMDEFLTLYIHVLVRKTTFHLDPCEIFRLFRLLDRKLRLIFLISFTNTLFEGYFPG